MPSEIETDRTVSAPLLPDAIEGRWWVAHTRPRAEKLLSAELGRLNVPHYLPLHERTTRSRKTQRISRSQAPVFSGYLFFAGTDDQRHQALRTNRIVNILAVVNQEQLIGELRQVQRVLESNTPFTRHQQLHIGTWVRVVSGALAGVEGVIAGRRGNLRVCLNVNTLGQCITLETSADAIEPIDPPTYPERT